MEVQFEHPAEDIKRLQRCINDLLSILALPAMWSGGEPAQMIPVLLDALLGILDLDLVYVRLNDPSGEAPVETVRVDQTRRLFASPREICQVLHRCVGDDAQGWPSQLWASLEGEDILLVPLRLGLQGEIGVIVAGSQRADFPSQTERLVLGVAANQASLSLKEAWLLEEQKRVARELDRRIEQRTEELRAANEMLKREIAERKQAEEELRRSQAFLVEGQRLNLTGSFLWRLDTDEITFSEQLYNIFAFAHDEPVTSERIRGRVHPEDGPLWWAKIESARRGNPGDLNDEIRLQMPDDSLKYLRTIAHVTRDGHGRPEMMGSVQDVTERRHAEEALGQVRSDLAQMARAMSLGVVTASIAHEVNQPLSGIVTNASTCLRMLASNPPNLEGAKETARRTIRDSNRASEVITRLRSLFSRKEATTEAMDLNAATREVIELVLSDLQRSRVVLRQELADDLPPVTGDRVQLQQVILNLLRNACDAMGGVESRPRKLVIKTEQEEGDRVRLTVQDAGVGIEHQDVDRLFEAFYTTKNGGMGIGLSLSRTIIENHRGRLWATPNDGPGVAFSFSIPSSRGDVTGAAKTDAA
jgi:signal transduction histidine kinase